MPSFLTEDFLNESPLVRYRREHDEQQAELARERRREKLEQQRTQSQQVAVSDDFWGQVDARIEQKIAVILETVSQALDQLVDNQHASIQAALDKRDFRDAVPDVPSLCSSASGTPAVHPFNHRILCLCSLIPC
jgi:hypothetical protein